MNFNPSLKKISALALITLGAVACSQQPFKLIDPKAKKAFLGNNWVFNDKVRVAGDGMATIDSSGQLVNTAPSGSITSNVDASSTTPPAGIVNSEVAAFCEKYPRLCVNGQIISTTIGLPGSTLSGTGSINSVPALDPSLIFAIVDWVNQANQNGETIAINITNPGEKPDKIPTGAIEGGYLSSIEVNGAISSTDPKLDIMYVCSNARTASVGGNLISLQTDYTVRLLNPDTNDLVCEMTSPDIRKALLDEKKLLLPKDCAGLGSKAYKIELLADKNDPKSQLLYGTYYAINGVIQSPKEPRMRSAKTRRNSLFVLYDKNVTSPGSTTDDVCDFRSSPLFIDMGGRGGQTELSAITDGVKFDVLGKNAKPYPHAKKQVSWFVDPNYMFLVKPNQRGQVNGVDEMFGNNTQGPDGRMAADGFHALAKFDKNKDMVIDQEDAIYQELRLWSDVNRDGIAEPGELFYLDYMGVALIDLRYNKNYYERDKYGNEIKYKSVVKMKDSSFRLMFDLWFRYL